MFLKNNTLLVYDYILKVVNNNINYLFSAPLQLATLVSQVCLLLIDLVGSLSLFCVFVGIIHNTLLYCCCSSRQLCGTDGEATSVLRALMVSLGSWDWDLPV